MTLKHHRPVADDLALRVTAQARQSRGVVAVC